MNEINLELSSQPKMDLHPSTLRYLNNTKLPNEFKEMLKERLEIARYEFNFPQPGISSRNFSLTTSISNVNRLFNFCMNHIENSFDQNEVFIIISCGNEVHRRIRNGDYSRSDWINDNPINNIMRIYIHKIFSEKGYHNYEETIVFSPYVPTLNIRYKLI